MRIPPQIYEENRMTTITITYQILAGNLGDGWDDELAAAYAYAEFVDGKYRAIAQDEFPGATIEINIDVQRASGCSRQVDVDSDQEGDLIAAEKLKDRLDYLSSNFWDEFCSSEAAASLCRPQRAL